MMLHASAGRRTLECSLKILYIIWFLRYAADPLHLLASLPLAYADPVGPIRWLPSSLREWLFGAQGLTTLRVGIVACCAGTWVRALRVPSALAGCVLLTAAGGVVRSFGHVNHAEIGPLLVTWVLTAFLLKMTHDDLRARRTERSTAATGMITATLVLLLTYAFVGVARAVEGGWRLLAGDTLPFHVSRNSHEDWVLPYDFSSLVLAWEPGPWLLKGGTLAVTVLEIAAPLALVSRPLRLALLAVLPAFHVGAALLFKVFFLEQALTVVLLLGVAPGLESNQSDRESTNGVRGRQTGLPGPGRSPES